MNEGSRLLEQRGGVTFVDCLDACIHTGEFVSEWQRLYDKKLLAANPLDRMIDQATGYDMSVMGEFADFVYSYVFKTLPDIHPVRGYETLFGIVVPRRDGREGRELVRLLAGSDVWETYTGSGL